MSNRPQHTRTADVVIRKMQAHEMSAVADIWFAASVQSHDFVPREFWSALLPTLTTEYLPSRDTQVAVLKSKVVGFVSLFEHHLDALFVLPSLQGNGIGSKLLTWALTQEENLSVCVFKKNDRALMFYQRHGFVHQYGRIESNTGEIELKLVHKRE
ncbi:GNAT family N-acetyltransferase [Idiomarina aquatica]|uniref:GNAT family N-acetyltransferase n=1 Tax=Idiomarina aquatica TaxID=1327752 RepID=A0AA94JCS8_9GAMM|nr:GNAT family N-acetyltransferase [Idiomarina aquatica]RUO42591.1 GNAT family N-acetyltransferase [Idiomarina aquatica]